MDSGLTPAAEAKQPPPLVELRGIGKSFRRGANEVVALREVSLTLAPGELVSIVGPSGSGKTTLLSIVGCLDRASSGEYHLDGQSVESLGDAALSHVRNRKIGFVFQSFQLIPQLTVIENVETPLIYSGLPQAHWRPRAYECLTRVGLQQRAQHRPTELSGGEAQRAALARALVVRPQILLADEPTGNLDSGTGEEIAELLTGLHREGHTIVIVTHNETLARRAPRRVVLHDGVIAHDGPPA
jgi:putative ABC transport system ATP-binding protein